MLYGTIKRMNTTHLRAVAALILGLCLFTPLAAGGRSEPPPAVTYRIGVFVPGVVDGSPTYEMMVNGVRRAQTEAGNASVTVVEGGFNQATWEDGVMQMASSARFDLIVTSNPSMPEIAARVVEAFPDQHMLVLDGYLPGNPRIHTVMFNQAEQAFLSGYFAGLVTVGSMPNANAARAVGLLAGQEYPIMNEVILPSYRLGARTVHPEITVDFRVLGNWHDAARAAEIVTDMHARGVDTVLTIAGGGNQGAIAAARERGAYVLWYDDSGYDQAPGVVVGSSFVRQDEAAYNAALKAIQGRLEYGEAVLLGVADDAVSFDIDHAQFRAHVPETIRTEMQNVLNRLRTGELVLEMPIP